jgi:hypothetical protein
MTEYRTLSVEITTKERFKDVQESLDTDTQTDALDRLIEAYQFRRLEDDKRIQEARQVVAQDHSVEPEDVSLACLLKVTAGAYTGFAQTDDWDIQGESHA